MKRIMITIGLVCFLVSLSALTVETASFSDFLYGRTEETTYDNFKSRVVEGSASPGYNQYAPWNRQTNGFGTFVRASSEQLEQWGVVVAFFMAEQFADAQDAIDEYGFPYDVVQFNDTDTGRTYYMLREQLNDEYFDDNGQPDQPEIHQHGSFDYGWGLYVFNPASQVPVIVNTPHPKDDFISIPISTVAFQEWNARFLMISGAGREAMWTERPPYTNGKSLSDPTRNEDHPFNIAYYAFCDDIRENFNRQEFSVQVHSFDYTHTDYKSLQIALGSAQERARYPGLPIRDMSGNNSDIINMSSYVIHPANSIGNNEDVLVTDYYAVYYRDHGLYYHHEELGPLRISNRINLTGIAGPQYEYTIGPNVWNTFDTYSPFFHIEMEELPSVYPQTMPYYHWFYGFDVRTQRWNPDQFFTRTIAYYKPWIDALGATFPDLFEFDNGQPPTNPGYMGITGDTGSRVSLTWGRSYDYDFQTYEVLRATEPINLEEPNYEMFDRDNLARLAAQAHTTITFTTLNPERDYYFAVRAKDYQGNYSDAAYTERFIGSARVTDFSAVGRDGFVEVTWTASWQNNNRGFKVWRADGGTGEFEIISSYEDNEFLEGNTVNNYPYSYFDEEIENEQVYDYRISYVDTEDVAYNYFQTQSAAAYPIFSLYFANHDSTIVDSVEFGMNPFSEGNTDENFSIRKPGQSASDYIYPVTYHRVGWATRTYQRDITEPFNPMQEVAVWPLAVRTDQLNEPITISLSDNYLRNENIYLSRNETGELFNLALQNVVIEATNTDWIYFRLHWGNLYPQAKINQGISSYVTAGDSLVFSWSIESNAMLIERLELYLANDTDSLFVDLLEESPSPDSLLWIVPEDVDIEGAFLYLKVSLIDGHEIIAKSNHGYTIINSGLEFAAEAGSWLFANPFTDQELDKDAIFGEHSSLFYFDKESDSYAEADSFKFGYGYWLNLFEPFEYETRGEFVDSEYNLTLSQGWNLVANPLYEAVSIFDLRFVFNAQTYSFREAIIFDLIEPGVYTIDNGIYRQNDSIRRAGSYLIYSYTDNLEVLYTPFYKTNQRIDFSSEWEVILRAALSQNEADEVIIGSAESSTEGYDRHYDLPKPPKRPGFDIRFMLYSDIESHPFPNMHSELKPDITDYEESRYWDFIVELSEDNDLPVMFSKLPADIHEDFIVEMIIGDETFTLSTEEEHIFIPENNLIQGQIRVSKLKPTSVEKEPQPAIVLSNYPNPFFAGHSETRSGGGTNISFFINETANVKLEIFNIKGQKVRTIINEELDPGNHIAHWNAADSQNRTVAAGIYFYRLKVADKVISHHKMLLMK